MEIKKSREADLEQKRTQSFLLGMIVVLASLFVLLEWNSGSSGWTLFDDDDSLEAEVEARQGRGADDDASGAEGGKTGVAAAASGGKRCGAAS